MSLLTLLAAEEAVRYTHSFDNTYPPARFDGVAWTRVLVEESPDRVTWTQLVDQAIAADPSPDTPNPVDVTVTSATLERGYFRFRFRDGAGSSSPYTAAVFSPATDTLSSWRPTVEEVAKLVPAYTRGGFDDDAPSAGAEQGTFTATTSPTAAHVEALITAAVAEVQGRVGTSIPERCHALASVTARWHVAAAIAGSKMPADTDDASGEYRAHISNFRASLDELVALSRMALGTRLR